MERCFTDNEALQNQLKISREQNQILSEKIQILIKNIS
jgi:hypothetical protein